MTDTRPPGDVQIDLWFEGNPIRGTRARLRVNYRQIVTTHVEGQNLELAMSNSMRLTYGFRTEEIALDIEEKIWKLIDACA